MNKKNISILILIAFLFSGMNVSNISAEEEIVAEDTSTTQAPTKANIQKQKQEMNLGNNVSAETQLKLKNNAEETTLRERIQTKLQIFQNKKEESVEKINEKKEQLQERKEEKLQQIQEKRELRKEKLDEKLKERITKIANSIVSRFEKTLEKLVAVKNKVQTRIGEMEGKGFDMTEAKSLMEKVPVKIQEAQQKIENMKNAFNSASDSENPGEAFTSAKEVANIAKEGIKEAHKSIVDVIESIKASVRTRTQQETQETTTGDNSDTSTEN
ncbi:hypothetical protein KKG48_03130 [Patescibacteria group bacterium]|nr:hypothetical protein [Patescibacteria group bacterium]MCG2694943.1 hypothetical protein [Candidatus Parcubacteria bacterium]